MRSTLPYETLEPVRKAVVLSFLGVALWYITWRLGTFNREALFFPYFDGDGWQKGFFYLPPAIVLVTGVRPLMSFGRDFLPHFLPYFLLNFWAFQEVNRGHGRSMVIEPAQVRWAHAHSYLWDKVLVPDNHHG